MEDIMSYSKYPSLILIILLIFFIIASFSVVVKAQISKDVKENLRIPAADQIQIITTRDKSTIIGKIVKIEEQIIHFQSEFGEITIPIQKIKKIEIVSSASIKGGKYWFPNPNATRLFIGSTGRTLKKGDGYFADSYVCFLSIAYGITNNFTIGGGLSLIPGFEIDRQMFYFTPKVGIVATKNLNLAVGALLAQIPSFGWEEEERPWISVLNFVGTYGSTNSSITFGLGFGFADGKLAKKPSVIIGGEYRIGRRLALVTENSLLPFMDEPMISYGIRFFGEKISVDLAFLHILVDKMISRGVPYVDFVFNF
jgi:hypothetical protein